MSKKTSPQSGNILVYILGAIFLLGVLIVITKGNYQPGTGIDAEGLSIKVSEVRRYASELERGVQYAMANGISETDLRFAHTNAASAYGTYGTNPKAEIFNPLGGGVEWKAPPSGIQVTASPWLFNGRNKIEWLGCNTNTSNCMELIAFLRDVTKPFCMAINNSLGITNPSGNPPKEASNMNVRDADAFAGTFTYHTAIDVTGDHIKGKTEACIEGNNASDSGMGLTGKYYYYKVLLVR